MFNNIANFTDPTNIDIVNTNLKFWLDDSFLGIGAYGTVNIGESGAYGGDKSKLIPVASHGQPPGKIWQPFRNNLVWEEENLRVSGVYVNNSPVNYTVNYSNGQIILDNPVNINSTVQANFSYKYINIYSDTEIDWFTDIQNDTYRVDNYTYKYGENYPRLQLPAIIFENTAKSLRPFQLGLGQEKDHKIVFHVLSQSRTECDRISDILIEQNEKTIFLFDLKMAIDSGVLPFNYNGTLNPNCLTYNDLIIPKEDGGYRWRKFRFWNGYKQERDNLKNDLYHCAVRFTGTLTVTKI